MNTRVDKSETRSEKRKSRVGGAAGRRVLRHSVKEEHMPFISRNVPIYEVLNEEGLATIEAAADTVLEEIGIEIMDDPETLALFKEAGADVKGTRIHFPVGLCRKLMETIPSSYTQYARNPERNVVIGGKNTVFAPVYGPPFVRDLEGKRRYATIEDFRNFVKLAYVSPVMHHSGGTVCEPVDVAVNQRHLDMVYSHIRYSDKPFMGSVTHYERAEDTLKMAALVFGEDFVQNNCVTTSLINVNSPLTYDAMMLGALKVYARSNQSCIVSPFILAGAMSPVTVAGTLTQILAEASVGLALTQLCRKGAPAIFGTFASSISMQSGAPTFGMPEPALILYGAAQIARKLNVPFRSGGALCSSKLPDAQAAYETSQTLTPAFMAGVNFMLHSAGWLEGGLVSSYEKFVLDVDQLGAIQKFSQGIDLSENSIALDALREVGPGQHFLGCNHTQNNFETAFYRSSVSDYNSYEQWKEEGEKDSAQRANSYCRKLLEEYVAPDLDQSIDESLNEFMQKRRQELEKKPEN